MVWFPVSQRKRTVPTAVIPEGMLKRAAAPVPSADPATPKAPAKVVTFPEASIFRITLFSVSATKRSPVVVMATPDGVLNRTGSEGEPSKNPGPPAPPAKAATDSACPTVEPPHPETAAAKTETATRSPAKRFCTGNGTIAFLLCRRLHPP